jgi:hypothetical protein
MKNNNFLLVIFNIQISLIIIGAILKILHLPFGEVVLGCGILVCLFFTVLSLNEIYSSSKLSLSKKAKWLFAFLFVNTIAGLYYILYSRKNVVGNYYND